MSFSTGRMLAFVLHALVVTPFVAGRATPRATTTPIPSYALKYAPYAYLSPNETYWPSDISTHIQYVFPAINYTHIQYVFPAINYTQVASSVSLENVATYPSSTFLTSKDNTTNQNAPTEAWLLSNYGKPSSSGLSAAPATIIAVTKPGGIVDVFYFMFYSYNFGNSFLGITFGDHVGDWEHQTVRFVNGVPTAVWLSAHSDGDAYTYAALPKQGVRPVTYIAVGDHANYATAGKQPYPVPVIGPIADNTGAGAFWDVTLNYRGFWYNNATNTFTSAGGAGTGGTEQATEGVSWLNFLGAWGDDTPPTQFLKSEQYCISTECHYTAGPSGPVTKNLGRTAVCEDESSCTINTSA